MEDKAKKAGRIFLRLVFPFAAIKRTKELALQEVERNKENFSYINDLRKRAQEAARRKKPDNVEVDVGFAESLASRGEGALCLEDLQVAFLRRKRWALAAGAFFLAVSVMGFLEGLLAGSLKQILLSFGSVAVALPAFFLIALSAQHRLWQLAKKRLSVEERGGLEDFLKETPAWWLMVLNPSGRVSKEAKNAE
jgi:hypothetical protein